MSNEDQINDLLDQWEDHVATNPLASPAAFVASFCVGEATGLANELLDKIEKLQRIMPLVARMGEPVRSDGQLDVEPEINIGVGSEPVPGYILQRKIGAGGYGEVWQASGPGEFAIAMKFVRLEGRGNVEREALKIAKRARHPNLVVTQGAWVVGGYLIVAMELAERTLFDVFEAARHAGGQGIPREELLLHMVDAAAGIDYLNDPPDGLTGIQHRDIKPQNLLIVGGRTKVADFGIARIIHGQVTGHTGALTVAYAAPEFFNGKTTNRSDQYSLAITYCHLLTGKLPFQGTDAEIMNGHLHKPPDLSMVAAEDRPALIKALAKRPSDRWNSCSELIQTLRDSDSLPGLAPGSLPTSSANANLADLPRKWVIRSTVLALLFLICLTPLFISRDHPTGNDQSGVGLNGPTVAEANTAGTATTPITLAVLDFDNHSQDPILDGFRIGFRDMLVTDLSKLTSIKIVERGRLKDLLEEHELTKSPFIDPGAAIRLGKGLSAKHVLTGSFMLVGNDIRVDVRIFSVETGEVMLADAVTDKKSNIFPLQQTLSAKVLARLGLQPSEDEQAALNEPQTNEFEAFRLYSEARLAQLQGKREVAKSRLKDALQLDPEFSLAARELDRLDSEALFRLSESQQHQLTSVGEIGRRLNEHWQEQKQIVEKDQGNAEYFAGIIVLAAHAGLLGDFDQERQLLISFWKRYSESVPPWQSQLMAQEIRQTITSESKFFQETVDSGYYGIMLSGIGGMTPTKNYLRTELQGHFHWPKWSVIWPFAENARTAFGQAAIASQPTVVESWKSSFEADLPVDPHDYLAEVIDYGAMLADKSKNPTRFNETMRICLSIANYYQRLQICPPSVAEELVELRRRILKLLDSVDANQIEPQTIKEALPVLEMIAKSETDASKREQVDRLLIRLVNQARVNEGLPVTSDEYPASFYGKALDGSPIFVVWHVGRLGGFDLAQNRIEDDIRRSLADALRAIPAKSRFNFYWAGNVDKEKSHSLFEHPQAADATAKTKGLAWLNQTAPAWIEETTSLGDVIETLGSDWDERGLVIIVALNEKVSLPQSTVEFLRRTSPRPRFLIVATKKQKQLSQLTAALQGTVILLKHEGDLFGNGDVVAEPWEVSK